jgi:hypothetical protein
VCPRFPSSLALWEGIERERERGEISLRSSFCRVREDQTAKVKSLKQQRHEERERRKQHEATNGAKGKQRLIQDDNEDDSYRSDAEEVCECVCVCVCVSGTMLRY